MAIRLVTFDALHTIITPRRPIHVQYSEVFAPYVGALNPDSIKRSFKIALKALQNERPAYVQGAHAWWTEVIRRTALGAGADEKALNTSINQIVPMLMKRFSSGEGYAAFEDSIRTIHTLHEKLGVQTAVVSNGDSRLRTVIEDLGFPSYLTPIILSEEEGVEKPSREIFTRTLARINDAEKKSSPILLDQCLHIGDELVCDYEGAKNAGMQSLLLRRPGAAGEQAHKEQGEALEGVEVIESLDSVLEVVGERNGR